MGVGAGLGTLLLAAVLQATSSSWFNMPGLVVALYLGLLVGGPIGYGLGVARIRRSTAGGAAYADLRPRRPRDYVSPLVRWLGAAPALALCLLTVLVVAHRARPLDQLAQLALLLAGMVTTLVVAELLLAHVVAVPRLVVTADPDVSRRADDMLRSHFVVSVESGALLGVGGLGIFAVAQLGVLASGWLPDAVLFAILVGYVAFVNLSLFLWLSWGRLGGRITGWPWSRPIGVPQLRSGTSP
jgi:energy-converting hydrogenase Eha subunit C